MDQAQRRTAYVVPVREQGASKRRTAGTGVQRRWRHSGSGSGRAGRGMPPARGRSRGGEVAGA